MADIPPPQPPAPGPYYEDEEFEHPTPPAWMEEMRWAEMGQYDPLIKSLRAGKPLDPEEDWEVLKFLADHLDGKIKRPRRRPPEYSERTWGAVGPNSGPVWDVDLIKKGYAAICDAASRVWALEKAAKSNGKPAEQRRHDALEQVASEMKLSPHDKKKLVTWLNRSTAQRRQKAAGNP